VLERTAVEHVVVWERKGLWGLDESRLVFYEDFRQEGSEWLATRSAELDARIAAVTPQATAMIIYTSGTTGSPKGAMLSHANALFMADALALANPVRPDDEGLSYLPLSHIFENLMSLFLPLVGGGAVSFAESIEALFPSLREVSPTVLAGVPRVWEKVASLVELRMQDSTWIKRRLYRVALGVGRRHARALEAQRRGGAGPSKGLALSASLARLLVLRRLCHRLGLERVRIALCGAAPASPEVFEYFHALGVPLIEGYGLTESSGVISTNRVAAPRLGTVGPPLDGIEVRIAEDGEILTRGPHVFSGYFRDPEQTPWSHRKASPRPPSCAGGA
jgi:long-chain acyl-CoA synthetase